MERIVQPGIPALRRMKSVLFFQLLADALTPAIEIVLIEPPAGFIHIDRDDMDMVPVYVLVLVNHVRLLSVAELFQILPRDVLQFRIGQHVVGMRVEGDVHHRFLHPRMRRHISHEIVHRTVYIHRPRAVIVDFVGGKELSLLLVDLLPVVGECAVQRLPYTDFCDHCASIFLESSTISRLNLTSSMVCRSSL